MKAIRQAERAALWRKLVAGASNWVHLSDFTQSWGLPTPVMHCCCTRLPDIVAVHCCVAGHYGAKFAAPQLRFVAPIDVAEALLEQKRGFLSTEV